MQLSRMFYCVRYVSNVPKPLNTKSESVCLSYTWSKIYGVLKVYKHPRRPNQRNLPEDNFWSFDDILIFQWAALAMLKVIQTS